MQYGLYTDLHCDTPLAKDKVINIQELSGFKKVIINFAFCFLKKTQPEKKKETFDRFLSAAAALCDNIEIALSIEGLGHFEDIEEIDQFLDCYPVCIVSLVWNYRNKWGCGCLEENDTGITSLGAEVIDHLSKKNIHIDISHASEKLTEEIFSRCEKVIATHSNVFDVFANKRNIKKWQIDEIVGRGGIIGINIFKRFLGSPSLEKFTEHIRFFLDNGYEEYMTLGSDFDGMSDALIRSPSEVGILADVIDKKFGADISQKFLFENLMNSRLYHDIKKLNSDNPLKK